MKITSLELQNFKSFKSYQKIEFDNKNIIIGKNGSGKSNLLKAINAIFEDTETSVQYNNNEEPASITVHIDNDDKRFRFGNTFSITVKFSNKKEYFINDNHLEKEEIKGIFENAGLSPFCFIMQGKINDIATINGKQRYDLVGKIAGVDKYEESKNQTLKLLKSENKDFDELEDLISQIESKIKLTEENKKKIEEYENLQKVKLECEYELMAHELLELNSKIDSKVHENMSYSESQVLDELEIENLKDQMNFLRNKISEDEIYLTKNLGNINQKNVLNSDEFKVMKDFNKENYENSSTIQMMENKLLDYSKKIKDLEHKREENTNLLKNKENMENEAYINFKANKYFEALGKSKENVDFLEKELLKIKEKIQSFNFEDKITIVKKRKNLWIEERKIKKELENQKEEEKLLYNKLLFMGKEAISIYEKIKERKGVLGIVYNLFKIPEDILLSFESVAKNSLFWIVVENENIALQLFNEVEGRVTFLALNQIIKKQNNNISDLNLIKMSDCIKSESIFKPVLEMVCKNFYISPDLKSGIELSNKHKINVVTVEGDICRHDGSIFGGFEKTSNFCEIISNLNKIKERCTKLESELKEIKHEIEINFINEEEEADNNMLNLKAFEKYLIYKIKFMKNGKINLPETSALKNEYENLQKSIPILKLELKSLENNLNLIYEKKEKLEYLISLFYKIQENKNTLSQISDKISRGDNNINNVIKEDISSNVMEKYGLIDLRSKLMKKMGINDFRVSVKKSKNEIFNLLKDVNKKLKPLLIYSYMQNIHSKNYDTEIREKLVELKNSKIKILEFIEILDQKKMETFLLTFSMITDNFSYYYKMITGKNGRLVLNNDMIDIEIADNNLLDAMSGGQKTVIALCLIFAIQKNDPSPFYVFDEIDANLDPLFCSKLYELVKNSRSQYFITSFKEDALVIADKIYGVVSKDKESFVGEIEYNVGLSIIKE